MDNLNSIPINLKELWSIIINKFTLPYSIYTIKHNKENKIIEINNKGIMVKTEKGIDLIKIELIEKAWENLVKDRILYRDDHKKSTYRSSFIFALFSHFKFIKINDTAPIYMELINLDKNIDKKKKFNYFLFVFNEEHYEDNSKIGKVFKFPDTDRGGYKFIGKSTGSWGSIINKVSIGDNVIWTISGNSRRKDKKTFWGFGEIIKIDDINKQWILKSYEFGDKIKIDEIIKDFPEDYLNLYQLKNNQINIGYYGTNQIDKFQYESIMGFYKEKKKLMGLSNQDLKNYFDDEYTEKQLIERDSKIYNKNKEYSLKDLYLKIKEKKIKKKKIKINSIRYYRDFDISLTAKKRANGICECCERDAPF